MVRRRSSLSCFCVRSLLRLAPTQFHASLIVLLVLKLLDVVSPPQDVICFGYSFAHRFDVPNGIFFGVAGHGKGDVVFECPCWSGVGCVMELPSRARTSRFCLSRGLSCAQWLLWHQHCGCGCGSVSFFFLQFVPFAPKWTVLWNFISISGLGSTSAVNEFDNRWCPKRVACDSRVIHWLSVIHSF